MMVKCLKTRDIRDTFDSVKMISIVCMFRQYGRFKFQSFFSLTKERDMGGMDIS